MTDYDDFEQASNHIGDLEKAEADNAALRAENARLLQEVLSPGTIPFNWQELEADNAALRKDAERYRWLRECMWWRTDSFTQDGENIRTGYWQTKLFRNQLYGNLDAAIDAALLAGKEKA